MTIPCNPAVPQREQRIGKLLVVGNDSFAGVCRLGLVRVNVHTEDNADPDSPIGHPSAFVRCCEWAEAHQDKTADGLFGLGI